MQLGRNFIGIELDPTYFDLARKRIEADARKPALFPEPAPPREKPTQGGLF